MRACVRVGIWGRLRKKSPAVAAPPSLRFWSIFLTFYDGRGVLGDGGDL